MGGRVCAQDSSWKFEMVEGWGWDGEELAGKLLELGYWKIEWSGLVSFMDRIVIHASIPSTTQTLRPQNSYLIED
jgi:hypothetical protein